MARQLTIRAFLRGEVEKKWLLTRLLPAIITIIGLSLLISGLLFPTVYDWRYMVISDLMSATANSPGFMFASGGIAVSGILAIPLVGYLHRRLRVICRFTTSVGTFFLLLGIVGMISVGILYDVPERTHVYVAAVAFLGLLFCFFFYGFPMLKDRMARFHGRRQFNGRLMAISFAMLWFAFLGTALSALYVEVTPNDWGWTGLDWIEKGAPVLASFALWEWIVLVSLLTNLLLLVAMIPETVQPLPSSIEKT